MEQVEPTHPLISVVAPVYKVEKYLRECVESVLAQTFTNFELILVDDGSPDKCGEICDELAKQDQRIRVFHQENGGVTSARRLGVEQARGEWICFVDPDDLLPKNSLEDLLAEATDDTDWVQGGKLPFNDGETPSEETRTNETKTSDFIGFAGNMLRHYQGPVAKIVRRRLFTPHVMGVPRDIRVGQDVQMNFRLIANKPRKIKEITKIVYSYRINPTSTTSSVLPTEQYTLRYAQLLLAELEKFPAESRERILSVISRHLCGGVAWSLMNPIEYPQKLAALMCPGVGTHPMCFFLYFCIKFNCTGIVRLATKIFCSLKGKNIDVKKRILLP